MTQAWEVDDEIIWEGTVDHGRFHCRVIRTDDRTGRLQVYVPETEEIILDEEVFPMFGAIFGPDVDDVAAWQVQCVSVIENWIGDHDD